MKIFYKKDFQRVLVEKEKWKAKYSAYKQEKEIYISQLKNRIDMLIADNKLLVKKDKSLMNKVNELNIELKKYRCAKGGYVKEINKLNNQKEEYKEQIEEFKIKVTDLEKQLKESMSDKYLVKKIPAGRTPTQKIKHIQGMKSNVSRYMKEKHDYE